MSELENVRRQYNGLIADIMADQMAGRDVPIATHIIAGQLGERLIGLEDADRRCQR